MNELFERLKQLDLPKGKYAVFGSGPICVRGLREGHDLDVIATEDLYKEFSEKEGWLKKEIRPGEFYLENNGIEFWQSWFPGEWNIQKLIDESQIIDGLPFVKLEEVLKWKKEMAREKDLEDVELIEKYLLDNQNL